MRDLCGEWQRRGVGKPRPREDAGAPARGDRQTAGGRVTPGDGGRVRARSPFAAMSLFRQTPKSSPPAGAASRGASASPGGESASGRPTADPHELLMLRSLFKGLPSNPEPPVISSALGRYASYLAQTKDTRVNLADEFFQASMNVSAENPDPRAVHTYHWFLCSQKKDFRSITQYERLRARAPIRGVDAPAMLAELGPMSGVGGGGGWAQHVDAAACLANFFDELCLRATEAEVLWNEVQRAAREGGDPLSPFTQAKYAAFLLRHRPERASEARTLFASALAEQPDNTEGMVDFASLLTATPALIARSENVKLADEWLRSALSKAPDDSRVLRYRARSPLRCPERRCCC